jgi:hypothetical protein
MPPNARAGSNNPDCIRFGAEIGPHQMHGRAECGPNVGLCRGTCGVAVGEHEPRAR